MPDLIRRAARRALTCLLLAWIARTTPLYRRRERTLLRTPAPSPRRLPFRFTRRAPADPVLLDDPSPVVRPYLVAHEQQERRTALALALDGVDVGPWVIHGHEVGTPVMGVAA